MATTESAQRIETRIDQWRSHLLRRAAVSAFDAQVREVKLREQITALFASGLNDDEAFLVAINRLGERDAETSLFARDHAQRQWKERAATTRVASDAQRHEALIAIALAFAAALLIKLPTLFGITFDNNEGFYARNAPFFVLPLVTAYFLWKRAASTRTWFMLATAFVIASLFPNFYPFKHNGDTEALSALHLPIALWLAVAIAFTGQRWRDSDARMDFVRFSGELFIQFVLIALGGMLFSMVMMALFESVGISVQVFFQNWLLPCGAVGAVVIASWLVDARHGMVGHILPLLTRIFTPFFALLLLGFLATMLATGQAFEFHRNLLLALDAALVVVLALHLYAISSRDPNQPAGLFDHLQLVLVLSALLVDVLALCTIVARIDDYGLTPNRVAALGENIILLINLSVSAFLYIRFLRSKGTFTALERWQTSYIPVYSMWAAVVVVVFPVVFGYV